MKIQYCSDLHLEFRENKNWLKRNPLVIKGDILLIAGDTFLFGKNFKDNSYFDYLSENFQQVFLIPGNHEFYNGEDVGLCFQKNYELEIRENVFLVNNIKKEIDAVEFLFTTLWSKIENEKFQISHRVNDFRKIFFKDSVLDIDRFNELFYFAWDFLKSEIQKESTKKRVVLTHHLPSKLCNSGFYKDSLLSEAFCVDLTEDILKSKIDFWIYGHSHDNISDFKIGNTKMLTNQLGYVRLEEHKDFRRDAFFEI